MFRKLVQFAVAIVFPFNMSFNSAFAGTETVNAPAHANTVQGSEIIPLLAATCSAETWKNLLQWKRFAAFKEMTTSMNEMPEISKGKFTFKKSNVQVQFEADNSLTMTMGASKISGKDLCDLLVKTDQLSPKKSALEIMGILNSASAENLKYVSESFGAEILIGVGFIISAVALGACGLASGGTAWFCIAGLAALAVTGDKKLDQFLNRTDQKVDFAKALNSVKKIESCSPGQIIVVGDSSRTVANKVGSKWEMTLAKSSGEKVVGGEFLTSSRAFFDSLAKDCKTKADAIRITADLTKAQDLLNARIAEAAMTAKPSGVAGKSGNPGLH